MTKLANTLTIGGDPELFLKDAKGTFWSAEDRYGPIIPGTKKNPYKVKGGCIQVDGVATEFNIDPAQKFEEFFNNIKYTITDLKKIVNKKRPDLGVSATPTAKFSLQYWDSLPTKSKELGCDPDYNAYTGKANPRPVRKPTDAFATGGGHVALGYVTKQDINYEGAHLDAQMVVKALDLTLYFASLDWDKDEERRKLYGSVGAYRVKPFGLEYRTLSNAWVKSPSTIRDVFQISIGTLRKVLDGKFDYKVNMQNQYGNTNTEKVKNYLATEIYDL